MIGLLTLPLMLLLRLVEWVGNVVALCVVELVHLIRKR